MLPLLARMQELLNRNDREDGATAVEYGIMVALIAAVIIAVVLVLGQEVSSAFGTVVDSLPN